MDAGRLDRRISIEARTRTIDSTWRSVSQEGWSEVCRVWANVQDLLPSRAERIADGVDLALRPCRVRIRWRGDVTGQMRVRYQDRIMQIVSGPVELGRRDGLEFICQEVSTEGAAP